MTVTDEQWLRKKINSPTEAQLEAFLERVAIMIAEGLDERQARLEALKGIQPC